jgi:NAD(P) transhydrogenase subunit beta
MTEDQIVRLIYLLAVVLFIYGMKLMTKIKKARRGNLISSLAMLLAMGATLYSIRGNIEYHYIVIGLVSGTLIGAFFAIRVPMTSMPEMVALFNGVGGASSTLVATAYYWDILTKSTPEAPASLLLADMITVILSIIVGTITLTGSVVAYGKLQGMISGKPLLFLGSHLLNLLLFIAMIVVGIFLAQCSHDLSLGLNWLYLLLGISALLGILLVTPIGGADMPVVISLLNSYSGVAAAATGFVLKNQMLIVAGSLVGSAGLILTQIMCKAMNRSLTNVLFGGFGTADSGGASASKSAGYTSVKDCSAEEAALMFQDASSVIIVPGYGLAVAQAQHTTRELAEMLEKRGTKVSYAIHPVAGRMPGHMNVLLAEANVPYDQLIEMEMINPEFKNTDIVLVLGANDVVNPAAIKDKSSPIYGMPILLTHEARTVLIVKRSLGSGFAGIINELFNYDNAMMIFGDAKKVLSDIITEMKAL